MPKEENVMDSDDDGEDQTFLEKNAWIINAGLVFLYVVLGVVVFSLTHFSSVAEKDDAFLTSLYLVAQIITTIGYGDLSFDESHGTQWFMSIYVFFGIAIVANIVNDVSQKMLKWQAKKMRQALRKCEKKALGHDVSKEPKAKYAHLQPLLISLLIFVGFLLSWALFFKLMGCTCSYGASAIEGCVRDNCEATGGTSVGFQKALYGGMVTFTTVGFGDVSPKSHRGRIFGIIWMVLGVLACGNFVTNLGAFVGDLKKAAKKKDLITSDIFESIDLDGNGTLSLGEFQTFYLVKQGIVTNADLDRIEKVFHGMDQDDSGKITLDEVERCCDSDNE